MTRPSLPRQTISHTITFVVCDQCYLRLWPGKNAPCAHNKVELNYQLGRACSNCYCEHSVAGTFVIEALADIIGVRDNEKEVELTRAEYQRVVAIEA